METVEFNFAKAETHNGDKYFFICRPDDPSGRYVRAEVAERLLAALKMTRGQWIHSVNADEALTAIQQAEEE